MEFSGSAASFDTIMHSMMAMVIIAPLLVLLSIALMGYDKKLRHTPAVAFKGTSQALKWSKSLFADPNLISAAIPSMSSGNGEYDDLFVLQRSAFEPAAQLRSTGHRKLRHTGTHRRGSRLSALHTAA